MKKLTPRLRDLIVSVLTALITFLMSSCAGVFSIGRDNHVQQEVHGTISSDSISFPTSGHPSVVSDGRALPDECRRRESSKGPS